MYNKDEVGRVWLDKDSFLAPFGHYKKDWEYVYNYFNDPVIAKRFFHDGMDLNLALSITEAQIKSNPSYIGFHKGKRSAYFILEQISVVPLVFVIHGGISRKLYGSGLPQKAFDFAKQFVFEEKKADKLEGMIMHPNKILEGYYKRGGLIQECEIRGRISVDKKLLPVKIFGMTLEDYKTTKKEKNHGRITPKSTVRSVTAGSSPNANRSSKKRARKTRGRKKHKRR